MLNKWTSLDPYTRREKLDAEADVRWEAKSKTWRLVETKDHYFFIVDSRHKWSAASTYVWVERRPEGLLWRYTSPVPAFVRRICERFIRPQEPIAA